MKALRAILLFVILIAVGFFTGGTIVAFTIPRPSGLAGAGIAAFWALFGAFLGLVTAVFIYRKVVAKQVIRINIIGILIIATLLSMLMIRKAYSAGSRIDNLLEYVIQPDNAVRSLGLAKIDFYNNTVVYFYNPNLDKVADEHTPIDSLVFKQTELGFEITYAPPWYFPAHMKLDYGILMHKVITVGQDWIELEVNRSNQLTAWVDPTQISVVYWPSFLLSVSSVEPLSASQNQVRVKPLDPASSVSIDYEILKPRLVKGQWLKVDLLDDNYIKQGEGWIRWKKDGQWMIDYSLLS